MARSEKRQCRRSRERTDHFYHGPTNCQSLTPIVTSGLDCLRIDAAGVAAASRGRSVHRPLRCLNEPSHSEFRTAMRAPINCGFDSDMTAN